jgi:hypothetical protein
MRIGADERGTAYPRVSGADDRGTNDRRVLASKVRPAT